MIGELSTLAPYLLDARCHRAQETPETWCAEVSVTIVYAGSRREACFTTHAISPPLAMLEAFTEARAWVEMKIAAQAELDRMELTR